MELNSNSEGVYKIQDVRSNIAITEEKGKRQVRHIKWEFLDKSINFIP